MILNGKIFGIFFTLIIIFSCFSTVSANTNSASLKKIDETREDSTTEYDDKSGPTFKVPIEEYNNLLALGFTQDAIQNMSKKEYLLNKDLEGELVATTTQYLKIIEPIEFADRASSSDASSYSIAPEQETVIIELDEETYYAELAKEENAEKSVGISALESSDKTTSYKTMTTSISKISYNNYRLTNSVVWSKLPYYRFVDVSGIGINSSFWAPTPGTEYGKQNWTTTSYCAGGETKSATYTTSSNKWKYGSGGYALKMNLPDDEMYGGCAAQRVKTLSSYMYYSVKPLTYTNRLDAYGHYAHQERNYTLSPGISLGGPSISVSPSTYFSYHPYTHVLVYK